METRITYIQVEMTGEKTSLRDRMARTLLSATERPGNCRHKVKCPSPTRWPRLCYTVFTLLPRFARDAVIPVGSATSPPFLPAVLFSVNLNVSGMGNS